MLTSIVLLGLVIGMQHAFEADHLAAISALVSRRRSLREMTRRGAVWGVGHTLALVTITCFVLVSPGALPDRFEPLLESVVGAMLLLLGGHLIYRLIRDRVHVHAHAHDDELGRASVHLHAHSHRGDSQPHAESAHAHDHAAPTLGTLLVGLTHGAAGSAALTVYVAASLESPLMAIVYVLLFGLGSILGMVALTAILALPLRATARTATWAHRGLQFAIGALVIVVGLRLLWERSGALWS